ncbi:hypothetical protein CGRA01v4_11183 [Colletotrichum graminicola]|nr:hypothetical protein CGRA01v4_11183 [Colletotrichum graminicola]
MTPHWILGRGIAFHSAWAGSGLSFCLLCRRFIDSCTGGTPPACFRDAEFSDGLGIFRNPHGIEKKKNREKNGVGQIIMEGQKENGETTRRNATQCRVGGEKERKANNDQPGLEYTALGI